MKKLRTPPISHKDKSNNRPYWWNALSHVYCYGRKLCNIAHPSYRYRHLIPYASVPIPVIIEMSSQSFLKSIHYDFVDSFIVSVPLWICWGGISIRYAQVTAIPLGRPCYQTAVCCPRWMYEGSQTEWQYFFKKISWHPHP